jgi:hypothetical protein
MRARPSFAAAVQRAFDGSGYYHILVSPRLPMRELIRHCLRTIHYVCLGVVLALAASGVLAQAPTQSSAALETTLKNMLTALQTNSLPDFVAAGDPSFKSGVTQEIFAGVSGQFGSRLAGGYTTTFLGTLNQQGFTVYLWKLVFKDGQDDRLVTMAVRDGRVAAFFLR